MGRDGTTRPGVQRAAAGMGAEASRALHIGTCSLPGHTRALVSPEIPASRRRRARDPDGSAQPGQG